MIIKFLKETKREGSAKIYPEGAIRGVDSKIAKAYISNGDAVQLDGEAYKKGQEVPVEKRTKKVKEDG